MLFEKVIASVLAAETREFTMPIPACAEGLFTSTKSPICSPPTVKVCSTVVLAATDDGEIVIERIQRPLTFPRAMVDGFTAYQSSWLPEAGGVQFGCGRNTVTRYCVLAVGVILPAVGLTN